MTASVPTWLREARSKKYSVISLYIAMSMVDVPFEGTITLLWSVLNYWTIGYGYRSVSHFLAFTGISRFQDPVNCAKPQECTILTDRCCPPPRPHAHETVILTTMATIGIGYFAAFAHQDPSIAIIINLLFMLPFMIFGGIMIPASQMPIYLRWISELSLFRYAFSAFELVVFEGMETVPCGMDNLTISMDLSIPVTNPITNVTMIVNKTLTKNITNPICSSVANGTAVLEAIDIQPGTMLKWLVLLATAIVFFRGLGLYMITNRVAEANAMGTIADSATDLGGKKEEKEEEEKKSDVEENSAPVGAAEIVPSSADDVPVDVAKEEDGEATLTLLAVRERKEMPLEFKNCSMTVTDSEGKPCKLLDAVSGAARLVFWFWEGGGDVV